MFKISPVQTVSKKSLQAILPLAASLTLSEAMTLLDSLDASFTKKAIYGDSGNAYIILFGELESNPLLLAQPCSQIGPMWFYGGPPSKEGWICGQASQYVADCILRAIIKFGERTVATKIGTIVKLGAP